MAKNIWDSNPPQHDDFPRRNGDKKPNNNINIVAYNILALAGYTIICVIGKGGGGVILDALLIAIHVFGCLIMSIANRSWIWLLSGLLVLSIGVSTCARFL